MARLAGRQQARAFRIAQVPHPPPWFTQAPHPVQGRGLQPAPLNDRGIEGMTEGGEIAVDGARRPGLGQSVLTLRQAGRGHLIEAQASELGAPPGELRPLVGLGAQPFAGQDLAAVALQQFPQACGRSPLGAGPRPWPVEPLR